MTLHPRSLVLSAAGAGLALVLAGCGEAGSSGTTAADTATPTANEGQPCEPVAGEELVVLEDDQNLQNVENIIPAINAEAANEPLREALNAVSEVLTTEDLIALNRQVVVERQTSPNVAQEYVEENNLTEGLSGGSGEIVIGAANFAENQTLAAIYEQALDAAGFDASTQTIGSREIYEPALERAEIQVVPEYVGTLAEFLNAQVNGADAEPVASADLQATVAELEVLGEQVGLTFAEPSEAANQNAFAVTQAFADEYGVSTLSELAETCAGGISLGGPPECPERPFCEPGLEETYGLDIEPFRALDAGGPLTKTALRQGEIALGLVFSSDAELSAG